MIDQDLKNRCKVIIEISKGNKNNKYEYDEKSKEFKLDFIFENVVWPFNYGFFPGTLGGDGDTLDAIVLSSEPLKQGREVEVKIVGMMDVLDRGEEDVKIICVNAEDPLSTLIRDISDISEAEKKEWSEFILELARQKKKKTEIRGFYGKERAWEEVNNSII